MSEQNKNRGCMHLTSYGEVGLTFCEKKAVAYYPARNGTMDLCANHVERFSTNPELYGLRDIKTGEIYGTEAAGRTGDANE